LDSINFFLFCRLWPSAIGVANRPDQIESVLSKAAGADIPAHKQKARLPIHLASGHYKIAKSLQLQSSVHTHFPASQIIAAGTTTHQKQNRIHAGDDRGMRLNCQGFSSSLQFHVDSRAEILLHIGRALFVHSRLLLSRDSPRH
jgi:hypothetical protein